MEDINAQIAALLMRQTYDERIELAHYIGGAALDLLGDLGAEEFKKEADDAYFASLLGNWAEEIISADEEPEA